MSYVYVSNGTVTNAPLSFGSVFVVDTTSNTILSTINVGSVPIAIAITPDLTKVYVVNQGSSTVSVISTSTNTVIATIAIATPGTAAYNIAITPDGTKAYVTNFSTNTISVINTSTNTVSTTITVTGPVAVAFTPDSSKAYVASQPGTGSASVVIVNVATSSVTGSPIAVSGTAADLTISPDGTKVYFLNDLPVTFSVIVISTSTNTVIGTISLSGGLRPNRIAVTPDGSKAYITDDGSVVQAIDLSTSAQITTISDGTGQDPLGIAITPDSSTVYVANANSSSIPVISTISNTIIKRLSVTSGSFAYGLALLPLPAPSASAYITNSGPGTVSPINLTTLLTGTAITVGTLPTGIAISPDYSRVYITNYTSGTVSVISTTTNTVIDTVSVGTNPFGIAVSSSGNYIYVANKGSNSVSVINSSTFAVTTITIGVGTGPTGIAVSPDNASIYVTNFGSGTVSVFNASTGALNTTVTVGTNPFGVIISPDGTKAFVANQGSNSVSIINTSTFAVTTITTGVGSLPTALAINPAGTELYVTNQTSGTVSVFNTSTNALITSITVGTDPYGISFTSDGTTIYVVNNGSNNISVINASTNTVIASIPLASGSNPVSFGQFIQPPSIPMTSIYTAPQGRLTLASNTPVMTGDATAQTSVYYTPYQGNIVPIYDGANMQSYTFGQLTMALNTSNQLSGKIYDLFVFLNSSVVTIGAGPAWSTTTSRGTGAGTTQLQQTDGLWVNANTITLRNGATSYSSIPVGEATYVGSAYMTANGQTGINFKPAAAPGGSSPILGLWNAYNRVPAYSLSRDLTTSWTYASATWRPTNNSTSNRVTWLDGLGQSPVRSSCSVQTGISISNDAISIGVSLNSTTATPNILGWMNPNTGDTLYLNSPQENFPPQLGTNYLQAMEIAPSSVTATFYGSGLAQTLTFQGEY
jgi:YVTN family beta-propeller protein